MGASIAGPHSAIGDFLIEPIRSGKPDLLKGDFPW